MLGDGARLNDNELVNHLEGWCNRAIKASAAKEEKESKGVPLGFQSVLKSFVPLLTLLETTLSATLDLGKVKPIAEVHASTRLVTA